MNILCILVPTLKSIPVIILVCVSHNEDEPKPPAGAGAPAVEPVADTKSRPAAEAKSRSSRTYFRVNIDNRAQVVAWLLEHGYEDYVIVPEPRPHKGILMQLLKRGIEIPGCTLEPSTRGKKDDED